MPWENGFCGVFNYGWEGGAYEMRKFACLPVGFICFLKFSLKRTGKIKQKVKFLISWWLRQLKLWATLPFLTKQHVVLSAFVQRPPWKTHLDELKFVPVSKARQTDGFLLEEECPELKQD